MELYLTHIVAVMLSFGGGVLFSNRATNTRIAVTEKRLAQIELVAAREYVTREELTRVIQECNQHMIRIEQKLDNFSRPYQQANGNQQQHFGQVEGYRGEVRPTTPWDHSGAA